MVIRYVVVWPLGRPFFDPNCPKLPFLGPQMQFFWPETHFFYTSYKLFVTIMTVRGFFLLLADQIHLVNKILVRQARSRLDIWISDEAEQKSRLLWPGCNFLPSFATDELFCSNSAAPSPTYVLCTSGFDEQTFFF